MPFVRIDLMRGKSVEYRKALGEIVYQAMIDVNSLVHEFDPIVVGGLQRC
jgi:Tautomerase enzyme